MEEKTITKLIIERLEDQERQILIGSTKRKCAPFFFSLSNKYKTPLQYFTLLVTPLHRCAFMMARFNIFPSHVTMGRYQKIPFQQQLCYFGCDTPDSLTPSY
uniref:Uncharacterized protein n=1 Tax=Sphaerodactylus townsendi TaxID=933632 RepID=A0ACB8GBJ1_9SAUR